MDRTPQPRRAAALAAGAALVLGITAPSAHASVGQPTVHGCLGGNTCLYTSQHNYDTNTPAAEVPDPPTSGPMVTATGPFTSAFAPAYVVNDSDPVYSSEGNFVLAIPGALCLYVPDTNDEQAPDTTEHTTDGHTVNAIQFGHTAAEANSTTVTLLSNCR